MLLCRELFACGAWGREVDFPRLGEGGVHGVCEDGAHERSVSEDDAYDEDDDIAYRPRSVGVWYEDDGRGECGTESREVRAAIAKIDPCGFEGFWTRSGSLFRILHECSSTVVRRVTAVCGCCCDVWWNGSTLLVFDLRRNEAT